MQTRTERRQTARARTPDTLRMSLPGLSDARVQNLSTAGVCCTTERPLPLLAVVQVTFLLPSAGSTCEVTCTGAVVRCVKSGPGDRAGAPAYESAIYFTEVDDADRTAIEEYVSSLRRAGHVA
jgi:hypothetical protein